VFGVLDPLRHEGAGSQFDPDIVDTFLTLLERDEPVPALVA